jgi:hypothetical protein
MKRLLIPLGPTSAGGAFTSVQTRAICGELYAIEYRPGTLDTGAGIVVTCEGDSSKALLTKTSLGTSNLVFYPRDLVHKVEDGAALTGTAGGDRVEPILNGWIKIVVSSGGNAMTGSAVIYYDD